MLGVRLTFGETAFSRLKAFPRTPSEKKPCAKGKIYRFYFRARFSFFIALACVPNGVTVLFFRRRKICKILLRRRSLSFGKREFLYVFSFLAKRKVFASCLFLNNLKPILRRSKICKIFLRRKELLFGKGIGENAFGGPKAVFPQKNLS
ncbi:MAG: hypothetical protein A2007_00580 [Verrucomicrobia bacterium GWC2_42_7]|nr:MAG: hypothetical protein A2007_00580 [Verrucomicrobia bacterium GWC2_42_7]